MKKNVSAAVALPTVVAIALGGLLIAAPEATAAPAPVEHSDGGAVSVVEAAPASEPSGSAPSGRPVEAEAPVAEQPDVQQPVAGQPDVEQPVVEADPVDDSVPAPAEEAAVPSADAVEVDAPAADAESAPLTVTSPSQGQIVTETGLTVSGTADFVGTVDVTTPEGEQLASLRVEPGPWSVPFSLPEGAAAGPRRIVVTAGSASTVLQVETRDVVFDVPTSVAPTITSPSGPVVVATSRTENGLAGDWGGYVVRGTGTPGSEIDIDISRTDGGESFGHGHDAILVRPDGTWTYSAALQLDAGWRVAARQFVPGGDFPASFPSPFVSVAFRFVAPAVAQPIVPAAAVSSAVAPAAPGRVLRPVASSTSLAMTGSETSVASGALGAALLGLGLLSVAGARLVRRRVRPAALSDAAAGSARRA